MEEEGFLLALAANPTDLLTHLVYADWLDEHNDPGGLCLRYWVELTTASFSEATFATLRRLLEGYRLSIRTADPEWVELVGRARPWVSAPFAELAARFFLRTTHGRKPDRQWLESPQQFTTNGSWYVPYWPSDPYKLRQRKRSAWRIQRQLSVTGVMAEVSETKYYWQ